MISGSNLLTQVSLIILTCLGIIYLGLSSGPSTCSIASVNIFESSSDASSRYVLIHPPPLSPDEILEFVFKLPVSLNAPETAVAIASTNDSSFHSGL